MKDITPELSARLKELYFRAKALRMTPEEIRSHPGDLDWLEAEIERRQQMNPPTWNEKMMAYRIRRKKIAAAYLAGASLNQLATLEQVTTNSIHTLVSKELPLGLRQRIADERMRRGRSRDAQLKPTLVSGMLAAVSDDDLLRLPIVVVAARMLATTKDIAEADYMEPATRIIGRKEPDAGSAEVGDTRADTGALPRKRDQHGAGVLNEAERKALAFLEDGGGRKDDDPAEAGTSQDDIPGKEGEG